MEIVINGAVYDTGSSEELYSGGCYQACSRENGRLTLYRSPKGTLWAMLDWWPNEFAPMRRECVAGEAAVRRLCESVQNTTALRAAFGPLPEG